MDGFSRGDGRGVAVLVPDRHPLQHADVRLCDARGAVPVHGGVVRPGEPGVLRARRALPRPERAGPLLQPAAGSADPRRVVSRSSDPQEKHGNAPHHGSLPPRLCRGAPSRHDPADAAPRRGRVVLHDPAAVLHDERGVGLHDAEHAREHARRLRPHDALDPHHAPVRRRGHRDVPPSDDARAEDDRADPVPRRHRHPVPVLLRARDVYRQLPGLLVHV